MGDPPSQSGFSLLGAVPWLLVIAGWWIVSHQNNTRERRKDIRELIKGLSGEFDSLIDNWLKYNLLDGSSTEAPPLAAKIKIGVSSVRSLLLRISEAGLVSNVDSDYISLKQQVTGGNFESKSRRATDFDENQHALIWTISEIIIRSIEKEYFESYSNGFSQIIRMDLVFSGFIRARNVGR